MKSGSTKVSRTNEQQKVTEINKNIPEKARNQV